jgi:hypothetical protein
MHLTLRWGDLFRAECLRYEAQIKAIDIVPGRLSAGAEARSHGKAGSQQSQSALREAKA